MSFMYSCIICGILITQPDRIHENAENWVAEFRTVYSDGLRISISGVGFRDDDHDEHFRVPYAPNDRYDSQGVGARMIDNMAVMNQPIDEDQYPGFLLHDACWRLILEASAPTGPLLRRLFDVCRSLPIGRDMRSIFWGHNYGGIADYQPDHPTSVDNIDWRDALLYNMDKVSQFLADPYEGKKKSPIHLKIKRPSDQPWRCGRTNCFSKLPWELLEAIATELPTADVLNARLAISEYKPILTSNIFWKSRFRSNGERGFLFEARQMKHAVDWYKLYQLTQPRLLSPGLRNRKRTWNVIQSILPILNLQLSNPPPTQSSSVQRYRGVNWIGGNLYEGVTLPIILGYNETFDTPACENCSSVGFFRRFGSQGLILPSDLAWVGVSVLSVGTITYVTGLRFVTETNIVTDLGYIADHTVKYFHVRRLTGLVVAMGSRGWYAVRVVAANMLHSKWIGNPDGHHSIDHLYPRFPIKHLTVGYDGFKIVDLQVS